MDKNKKDSALSNELKTLIDDEYKCYFVWRAIQTVTNKDLVDALKRPGYIEDNIPIEHIYNLCKLPFKTISHQERYEIIEKFFDALSGKNYSNGYFEKITSIINITISYSLNEDEKWELYKKLLGYLKDKRGILNKKTPWFVKNDKNYEWGLKFLKKEYNKAIQSSKSNGFINDIIVRNSSFMRNFSLIEEESSYLEIFFSLFECDDYIFNNILNNLSKAYSQKKFREKMKEKVPLNIHIEPETKKHLDYLAKYYDIKHHAVIEKLINPNRM